MHTVVVTMWTPTKKNEFGHTLFWVILLVPPLPLCRQPKTHKLFKFLIVMSPLFFVVVSPLLPRGSTSIPSRYQGIVFDNTLYGIFVHIVLVLFVIPQTGACSLFLAVIGAIILLLCLLLSSFFSSGSHHAMAVGGRCSGPGSFGGQQRQKMVGGKHGNHCFVCIDFQLLLWTCIGGGQWQQQQ